MDDHFLEQFRKKPRPEFARQLYARLNQEDRRMRSPGRLMASKVLLQGFLALSLVVVLTLAVVIPGALARPLGSGAHYLPASTVLLETSQRGSSQAPTPALARTRVVTVNSLADARRLAGFRFNVPDWAPQGMVLESSVKMAGVQEFNDEDRTAIRGQEIFIKPYAVGLTYHDTHGPRRIQFWVVRSEIWSEPIPPKEIGKGSFEAVKINGLPGGLVQGQWSGSGSWNYYRGGFLLWVAEGLRYYVVLNGAPLVDSDLLKIASSVQSAK